MTLVLAIETATPRCSCALGTERGLLASFAVDRDRRHVESLAPAIAAIAHAAGVALAEVDLLAVDVGPGLFTGMRVGIATATGLASALGRPVVEVSSLDVLAHPLRHAGVPVVPVVDARRGEVFRRLPGGEPGVVRPAELAEELTALGGPFLAVGDGAARHAALLEDVGGEVVAALPTAEAALELALLAGAAAAVAADAVRPRYLREADAKPNFRVLVGGGA